MTLADIADLPPIEPWHEGEKIPWNDSDFSRRMLLEHLTQEHDLASRRSVTIDQHVAFLHGVLGCRPSKVLDLGCGPGLYTSRLARLGHECVGIDFSPASIEYARSHSGCYYIEADVRDVDYGNGYGLATMVFGELNVFHPSDAGKILLKAREALEPGGKLVLEVHTYEVVRAVGEQSASWYAADRGLFSDEPYLFLEQNLWDADTETATTRMLVVDSASGNVRRYGSTMQAYTEDGYRALLHAGGFADVRFFPSLTGEVDSSQDGLFAIVANRQ